MISGLIDHLWQSTIFAGAAWLVTLALKRNRAQVRYWVWLAASVKFLTPFSMLVGLAEFAPKHTARPIVQPEWVVAVEEVARPLAVVPIATTRADRDYSAVLWLAWALGLGVMLISFGRKWTRMNRNARKARPLDLGLPIPVRCSQELFEPGVFGVFRPILLLPEGIVEKLSAAQFKAIIAHEFCHVRRRDNLTATIHMIVQAIFWFHPLVWWIGVRLIDERERACDEEVLRLGSAPQDYAEGILNVCKLYVESPMVCVSGVTGSDLKKRIEAIMKNRIIQKLSAGRKVLLAGAGVVAASIPVMIGFMHAPAVRAQSSTAPVPKWEVTSVRRCDPPPPDRGGRSGLTQTSPGRLTVRCGKVAALIQQAYVRYPDGQGMNPHAVYESVDGGPSWIKSDPYNIEAKLEGTPSMEMMNGPMMQALLEDRFKLKIHREVKEVPVYNLVVARGGAKMPKVDEAGCPPMLSPAENAALFAAGKPRPKYCGTTDWFRRPVDTSAMTLVSHGVNLTAFARGLTRTLDRPVLDKTGLTGLFDFHVEFSPDQATPGLVPRDPDAPIVAADPTGPSFVTAIQEQLGLKLEPARGPGDFLVIDSIERPSEN
jgi:bla regulator protein blaR1